MQDVYFVAVFFFASGIGFLRGVLFCRRVGFPQGQLYAVRFVVLVPGVGIAPGRFLVCWLQSSVFVSDRFVAVFMGCVQGVFLKKISRFGSLFIVNFCLQNALSRPQCTDSVQNHKINTLARYIAYSWAI